MHEGFGPGWGWALRGWALRGREWEWESVFRGYGGDGNEVCGYGKIFGTRAKL